LKDERWRELMQLEIGGVATPGDRSLERAREIHRPQAGPARGPPGNAGLRVIDTRTVMEVVDKISAGGWLVEALENW